MGVLEQARGKLKQAIGDLTDNDALRIEGEAQLEKAAAERGPDRQSDQPGKGGEKVGLADAWNEE